MSYAFPGQTLPALPSLHSPDNWGVAIVGAGSIVNSAHLPAYQRIGLPVTGVFDIDQGRAEQTAKSFQIERVYASVDELLNDDRVRVVDIAVPPAVQETILTEIAKSGRHVLCQKPLARDSNRANELVAAVEQAGVHLAINVNMRFSPAIRVLQDMLRQDALGQLVRASMDVNFFDTWSLWPWLQDVDELLVWYDAVHLIDALRFLFGEAESVYATSSRLPDQAVQGETAAMMVFRYSAGFLAFIHDSAHNWAQDTTAEFRIEGTRGAAKGLFGVWYNYPKGRADRIEFCPRDQPGRWIGYEPPGRWVPDAWAWTMAELLTAINEEREPINSGRDHIRTLQYVEAVYESMAKGQAVPL
jgi:predicted dehydrogenase